MARAATARLTHKEQLGDRPAPVQGEGDPNFDVRGYDRQSPTDGARSRSLDEGPTIVE